MIGLFIINGVLAVCFIVALWLVFRGRRHAAAHRLENAGNPDHHANAVDPPFAPAPPIQQVAFQQAAFQQAAFQQAAGPHGPTSTQLLGLEYVDDGLAFAIAANVLASHGFRYEPSNGPMYYTNLHGESVQVSRVDDQDRVWMAVVASPSVSGPVAHDISAALAYAMSQQRLPAL